MIPKEWRNYTWEVRPLVIISWLVVSPAIVLPLLWIWSLEGVDWPAWVQAVGSVGAICVAIWVSERSHKRDRERDEQASLREEMRVCWIADCASAEVDNALSCIRDRLSMKHAAEFCDRDVQRAKQAAEIMGALLLKELPHSIVVNVFDTTTIVTTVQGLLGLWDSHSAESEQSWQMRSRQIEELREAAKRNWAAIHAEYVRVSNQVGLPCTRRVF